MDDKTSVPDTTVPPPAPTGPEVSIKNGTKITAIAGAAVLIIGALATGVVAIIGALSDTKEAVTSAATRTQAVAEKVVDVTENQKEKLQEIHVLVNSRYSTVLEELARVRALLADKTNLETDEAAAKLARKHADDQEGRVQESKDPLEDQPQP